MITNCKLKLQGCLSDYTTGHLSIPNAALPFDIIADKDIQAGWTETVCIECTNDAGSKV